MSDLDKIVQVDIARETRIPTQDGFGVGAIIAEFSESKVISTVIAGRYLLYSSTASMLEDGWATADRVYQAAKSYFLQNPNPGIILIGRKDSTDTNWTETLAAIQDVYTDWYGFTIISTATADIKEAAAWAELNVKLFGYTTGELPSVGTDDPAKAGRYVSGAPGLVADFALVSTGSLGIALNGGATIDLTSIDFTAKPATSGKLTTTGLTANLSTLITVDDGEMIVDVDGTEYTVDSLDFTSDTTISDIAATIETALTGASCDSSGSRLIFESDTTGTSSVIVITAVDGGVGTDLTGSSYLNISNATLETGTAVGGAVSSYADIASVLEEAVQAGDVSLVNVTVEWDDVSLVFRSPDLGATSQIQLFTGTAGIDLFKPDYVAEGFIVLGKAAVLVADGLLLALETLAYDNTVIAYNALAQDMDVAVNDINFMWGAMIGEAFPYDPGSQTWVFKGLTGITPSVLGDTALTYLQAHNGNVYVTIAGVDQTMGGANGGKVVGGEYIDIIRGTAWLQLEIQISVFTNLLANRKIPFTDIGGAVIELAVRSPLMIAADNGLLDAAQGIVVTVPKVADVSAVDKAARTMTNVTFTAVYAGAIQKVEIQGSISV